MSPLNLVGMLFLFLTPSIQPYRTDFGPDDSLNTISSTPYPTFGQSNSFSSSKAFASSFASAGSYSSSQSSSGYGNGIPHVSVNDAGSSGIKSGSGAFATSGSGAFGGSAGGAFGGSAAGVNPGLFGFTGQGSKIAESVNTGLGNPYAGGASYSSSGSFSSSGSTAGANSYTLNHGSQNGVDGKISGNLGTGFASTSGVKNIANDGSTGFGSGNSGAGHYSTQFTTSSGIGENLGGNYDSGIKTTISGQNAGQSGIGSSSFSTGGSISGSGLISHDSQLSTNSEVGSKINGNLGGSYGSTGAGVFVTNGVGDLNSGIYNKPIKSTGGKVQYIQPTASTVNIKHNPFLTGQIKPVALEHLPKPIIVSDSSSASSYVSGSRASVDISKNPFLTGSVPPIPSRPVGCNSVNGGSCSGSSSPSLSVNGDCSGGVGSVCGSKPVLSQSGSGSSLSLNNNPFLGGSYQPQPAPQKPNIPEKKPTDLSTNPFLTGGNKGPAYQPSVPQPQLPSQSFPTTYPQQPTPLPQKPQGFPSTYPQQGFPTQKPQGIPTNYPQQPQGFPTQKPQGIPTSYPQQPQGFPTQKPQGIPTSYPQQPQGFPTQKPQGIPTSYPQQPQGFPTTVPQQPQVFPSTYSQQPPSFPTAIPQSTFPQIQPGKSSVLIDSSTVADKSRIQCGSFGYTCVPKEHCVNGVVTKYGEGLLQARTSLQYCKEGIEACCQLDKSSYSTPSIVAPSSPPVVAEYQKTTSSDYHHSSAFSGSTSSTSSSKIYSTNNQNQIPQSTIGNPSYIGQNLGPLIPGSYSSSGIIHIGPDGNNPFRHADDIKGPAYLPPLPSPSTPQFTTTPPEYLPPKISTPRPTTTSTTTTTTTTPRPTPRPTTQPPTYLPPRQPDSSIIYLKTTPTTTTTTTQSPNAYLPPYDGEGSDIRNPNILPPYEGNPSDRDQTIVGRPTPPTTPRPVPTQGILLNTALPAGCAAALKCVPIEYCTAEGVISNTTVRLTPQQNENRVPTTECLSESNVIGRCCRDPTYKDPWPVGQLGLWNPDNGFDNGQYTPDRQAPQRINNQLGPQTQPRFPPSPSNPFASGSIISPTQVRPSTPSGATCGIRKPNSSPRGNSPIDASFGEIPWQAMVLRDSSRKLICGGVIVRPDAVVTAAHCVQGIQANDILVKGGEWRLGIDEEPKPFQIVKVSSIAIHPQYSSQNQFNDVAILFLAENFRFDQHIDAICLPGEDEVIENNYSSGTCIATGWGKQALNINIQNSLIHRIPMNFLQPDQCQSALSNNYQQSIQQYSPSTCICGTPKIPQNNLCDVDQGSALACDPGTGHYVLSGIYSWETGCDQGNQIGGFTRLDMRWILSQLNKPSSGSLGNTYRQQQQPIYQQKPIPNPYFGIKGSFSQNRPQYQPLPISHNGAEPPCNCEG